MRAMLIAAIALVLSCGGSESGGTTTAPPPPDVPLDSRFTGTWIGTTSLVFQGGNQFSGSGSLVVAVAGHSATVSGVCPIGTSTVSASGSGGSATWGGTLICPAVAFSDCAAVVFTYRSGSLVLNASGTLTAQATGSATGCSLTLPLTITFVGTK